MYKAIFHPRTKKFLKNVTKKEFDSILRCVDILQRNPLSNKLNIKKLTNMSGYRLRVGKIRVLYELDIKNSTVYIHLVGYRGNVY